MLWTSCAGIWQNTISSKSSVEFDLRLKVEEVCALSDGPNAQLDVHLKGRAPSGVIVFNFSNLDIREEAFFAAEVFQKHHRKYSF